MKPAEAQRVFDLAIYSSILLHLLCVTAFLAKKPTFVHDEGLRFLGLDLGWLKGCEQIHLFATLLGLIRRDPLLQGRLGSQQPATTLGTFFKRTFVLSPSMSEPLHATVRLVIAPLGAEN
eukprot:scaffold70208_cov40-Cyclotella_meneghiniana.AAC.2